MKTSVDSTSLNCNKTRRTLTLVVALLIHQVTCYENTQLVSSSSNDFANRLYQKVSQPKGDVLVCPFSLHVALALLHQGAGGNTAQQLATALGFGSSNSSDLKESYKAVLTGIKDNALKVATKLFPVQNYTLNKNYVSIAQNYFLSDVENLDYSNARAAASKINRFVEEKTNNKIHDLISPDDISDLTMLTIVNAVYFQASWKKQFQKVYSANFKVSKTDPPIKTQMMFQTNYFEYKEDAFLQAKVLKMDYSEADYSMLFILPNEVDGLKALEAKLGTMTLANILKDLWVTKVNVTIPKFKLEQTLKLKQTLSEMGMRDIFYPGADLHKVASGGEQLYVSHVIQKTYINVHEKGTEAAAATGIVAVFYSVRSTVTFHADHPFAFYLIGKERGIVLFQGRLQQPPAQD